MVLAIGVLIVFSVIVMVVVEFCFWRGWMYFGFEFGVDDSVDDVRSVAHGLNVEADELGIDFTVRIYVLFGGV